MSDEPKTELYCYSKINGTTFREEEDNRPLDWDDYAEGITLLLIREPDNVHDPCAIKVYHKQRHIGYIPRNTAMTLSKLMEDNKLRVSARIEEVAGGTEGKENRGINISIWFRKFEEEKEFKCIHFDGDECLHHEHRGDRCNCAPDDCNDYEEA